MDILNLDHMQTRKGLERWENEGGKIFVDSAIGGSEGATETRFDRVKRPNEVKRNPLTLPHAWRIYKTDAARYRLVATPIVPRFHRVEIDKK